ncbi:MepB family protein [Enterococcus sp. 5H]|uniref:MepB family protein n=1 Tax=Enterococcus sp. 5H TaxID=1229490 RepID=UPI00230274FD|nr:MepB family protein [Enterococcus sp. 5H]MDA9472355.1 hypothetical protein [Enterococcus sp. 5H]
MESIDYISKLIYQISQSSLENVILEEQNKDYEGAFFTIGKHSFRSRKGKRTPKKQGYFVVFWEKDTLNNNKAYDFVRAPDKLIITIFDEDKRGQFIFPKELLAEKNILSTENKQGKMALRVYPDWVTSLNKTASMTQKWQLPYFLNLSETYDSQLLKQLYFNETKKQ